MKHLEQSEYFTHIENAFRAGLSCVTELVEFINDLLHSFDLGEQVDCIFLDFRKVFDVVTYTLLQVSFSGIHFTIAGWIHDYLLGRTQHGLINGVRSHGRRYIIVSPIGVSFRAPIVLSLYQLYSS